MNYFDKSTCPSVTQICSTPILGHAPPKKFRPYFVIANCFFYCLMISFAIQNVFSTIFEKKKISETQRNFVIGPYVLSNRTQIHATDSTPHLFLKTGELSGFFLQFWSICGMRSRPLFHQCLFV